MADAGEPRATSADAATPAALADDDAPAPRSPIVSRAGRESGVAGASERDAARQATKPARAVHLTDALLTLAAGIAAAIPVIAATVRAIETGWVPVADRGIIATRAHDVFTGHMPLVGQYTLAGEVTGHVTHSLGPMLFWLLAVPAYYGSTVGMTVVMGATNTLSIVGCVALARRHGGRVLMVMSAGAIALMCQSLAAETFHDVWNPSAGLFPFTLLIFLCWSVACGSYRLLPLTVVVASFVVQTHLTYLPPTLALLAVGLGGLTVGSAAGHRRRRREVRAAGSTPAHAAPTSNDTAPAPAPDDAAPTSNDTAPAGAGGTATSTTANDTIPTRGQRRRRTLGWGLATVLAAAACWSATVVGQLTEHPGNLTLVARSATTHKATEGGQVGWHAVVRAVGVTPWWLQTPRSRWQRKYEVRARPSAAATRSCIALLTALALVLLGALLCRRRAVAALAACALVLCPALAAVAAATPTPRVLSATLGYTMWWGSQAGMAVWLALAWAVWLCVAWGARRATQRTGTSAGHAGAVAANAAGASNPATFGIAKPTPRGAIASPTPRSTSAATPPGTVADPGAYPAKIRTHARAALQMTFTLLAVAVVAVAGETVAAQGQPDEHAVTYAPIRRIDARLNPLVPRGGSVLLEGTLDGATMPVKPAVRYFLVARGTRVLAPGSRMRLGDWYELYDRPYREAIYLSDVPRPPVEHVPLAFAVRFREGRTRNTVYVWISRHPGR